MTETNTNTNTNTNSTNNNTTDNSSHIIHTETAPETVPLYIHNDRILIITNTKAPPKPCVVNCRKCKISITLDPCQVSLFPKTNTKAQQQQQPQHEDALHNNNTDNTDNTDNIDIDNDNDMDNNSKITTPAQPQPPPPPQSTNTNTNTNDNTNTNSALIEEPPPAKPVVIRLLMPKPTPLTQTSTQTTLQCVAKDCQCRLSETYECADCSRVTHCRSCNIPYCRPCRLRFKVLVCDYCHVFVCCQRCYHELFANYFYCLEQYSGIPVNSHQSIYKLREYLIKPNLFSRMYALQLQPSETPFVLCAHCQRDNCGCVNWINCVHCQRYYCMQCESKKLTKCALTECHSYTCCGEKLLAWNENCNYCNNMGGTCNLVFCTNGHCNHHIIMNTEMEEKQKQTQKQKQKHTHSQNVNVNVNMDMNDTQNENENENENDSDDGKNNNHSYSAETKRENAVHDDETTGDDTRLETPDTHNDNHHQNKTMMNISDDQSSMFLID